MLHHRKYDRGGAPLHSVDAYKRPSPLASERRQIREKSLLHRNTRSFVGFSTDLINIFMREFYCYMATTSSMRKFASVGKE